MKNETSEMKNERNLRFKYQFRKTNQNSDIKCKGKYEMKVKIPTLELNI